MDSWTDGKRKGGEERQAERWDRKIDRRWKDQKVDTQTDRQWNTKKTVIQKDGRIKRLTKRQDRLTPEWSEPI